MLIVPALLLVVPASGITEISCDILVCGGSTASLAAAITAAENAPDTTVCFADPTDWPGGQMTASAVSAIDFGALNRDSQFQPKTFQDLVAYLHSLGPSACWVSTTCYEPQQMINGWVNPKLASLTNLCY
eukprot:m.45888 g.45888  ORF g.45888 m.45888 type:complete len:130 (+) comp10307_c0_seq1:17-406(+)